VVLGRKGSLGGVYYCEVPFWPHDTTLWVKDFHGNDPRFVYYWLQTLGLGHYDVGASNPTLNRNHVHLLSSAIPEMATQRKIAAILSAYDDLIENNSRRIKLLEEMAQRIYQEWFVDFRYPGHEGVPLVDSELGPIPEGWGVRPLSSLTDTISRGVSPKYVEISSQLVINQKCIRNGTLTLALARTHVTTVPPTKMLQLGDVLINSTGVGTLGRVAQVLFPPERVTVDSHVTIVRPAVHTAGAEFLGLTLLAREPDLEAMGVGSTGQTELGRTAIGDLRIVVPPLTIQEAFANSVGPARRLPIALAAATFTLRATRDLLLPHLISGEIDVTDLNIAIPDEAA